MKTSRNTNQYKIKKKSSLSPSDIDEITGLKNTSDSLMEEYYSFFYDTERSHLPVSYLAYKTDGGKLVGALNVFATDDNCADFCVLVHPEFRNEGIFTELFDLFMADYSGFTVSFQLKADSPISKHLIGKYDFDEDSTDYLMKLSVSDNKDFDFDNRIYDIDYKTDPDKAIVFFMKDNSSNLILSPVGDKTLCLNNVYVSKEYRNKGLATNLLSFAIDKINELGDYSDVILHVSSDNPAAISLYKKIGFEIIDTSINYLKRM